MRRTTIILLTALSSLLLLSVIFIVHLRFFAPINGITKRILSEEKLSGKVDSINVSLYKVIKFVDEDKRRELNISNSLIVQPFKSELQKGMFCFPKELSFMINKQVSGDTLIIKLKYPEKQLDALLAVGKYKGIHAQFNLYTDSVSPLAIKNESRRMVTVFKRVISPEITLYATNETLVDSCKIDKLNISGFYPDICLTNSKINIVSLDLDNFAAWHIEKCNINEEHLTGSKKNYIDLPKSECKKMIWKGKTKDAELQVNLKSDKAAISF